MSNPLTMRGLTEPTLNHPLNVFDPVWKFSMHVFAIIPNNNSDIELDIV